LEVMKGGRARWKIENETFNTLKNQGYNFEHSYGHGKKNLANNFAVLTLLAFAIDQIQEMSCNLFKKALKKRKGKRRYLWDSMKAIYHLFVVGSWDEIFEKIIYGANYNTS